MNFLTLKIVLPKNHWCLCDYIYFFTLALLPNIITFISIFPFLMKNATPVHGRKNLNTEGQKESTWLLSQLNHNQHFCVLSSSFPKLCQGPTPVGFFCCHCFLFNPIKYSSIWRSNHFYRLVTKSPVLVPCTFPPPTHPFSFSFPSCFCRRLGEHCCLVLLRGFVCVCCFRH